MSGQNQQISERRVTDRSSGRSATIARLFGCVPPEEIYAAATVRLFGAQGVLAVGLSQIVCAADRHAYVTGVSWKSFFLCLSGVLALTHCCGPALQAAEGQVLFNGRNLEGWSGDENVWSVQDGLIVGSSVDHKIDANTFLVWQGGEVGDFRLTLKARVEGGNNSNSGVQYRSKLTNPKKWRIAGYQADIHPKPEYTGMLYSEGTGRGIVAKRGQKVIVDSESSKPKVVGQTAAATPVNISKWHEYAIIARGNHLIHQIDGRVAVDVTDNCKDKLDRGIIALQVHIGPPMTVFFKDIVLETLAGGIGDGEKNYNFPGSNQEDTTGSEGNRRGGGGRIGPKATGI